MDDVVGPRISASGTDPSNELLQPQPNSNYRRRRDHDAPGNLVLPARVSGLARDSVVNVSQIYTLDRSLLAERAGTLTARLQVSVDAGLRSVLEL